MASSNKELQIMKMHIEIGKILRNEFHQRNKKLRNYTGL